MINMYIEVPDPDVIIFKQEICGPKNKTAMCSKYGFIDYEQIPRGVAGIYNFYNKSGDLLYCGQTNNLRSRVREHFYLNNSPLKWHRDEIYKIEIILVPGTYEREILETYIINERKSKYNIEKAFHKI